MLPKEELPKAGAPGVVVAGLLPKELEPNAGVVDEPAAVDQGDALAPSVEGPPKAGVTVDDGPNAGAFVADDANAEGAVAVGVVAVKAGGAASEAIPGYVVPPRMDSL